MLYFQLIPSLLNIELKTLASHGHGRKKLRIERTDENVLKQITT